MGQARRRRRRPGRFIFYCFVLLISALMTETGMLAMMSLFFSGIAALIHTIFNSMSLSRCTDIDCFCVSCKRAVLSGDELERVLDHQSASEADTGNV